MDVFNVTGILSSKFCKNLHFDLMKALEQEINSYYNLGDINLGLCDKYHEKFIQCLLRCFT